jgi:hypothetical protein
MLAAIDYSSIIGWCLVIVALIVVGAPIVFWFRRWLTDEPPGSASLGLTLQDLRQLHREGKLSDNEFERARATIASGLAKQVKPNRPNEKSV